MASQTATDPQRFVGTLPEQLTPQDHSALAGNWIALDLGADVNNGRRIEAIGGSVEDCVAQLVRQGRNPGRYEYSRIRPAYYL